MLFFYLYNISAKKLWCYESSGLAAVFLGEILPFNTSSFNTPSFNSG